MNRRPSIAPVAPAEPPRAGAGDPSTPPAGDPATAVVIRRIVGADQDGLRRFYAGLSEESRRTRFLGPTNGIGDGQSTYFCTPDHAHREGFVAVVARSTGADRIVGHVCVEPDGPDTAEVAVAVADDVRGHGIGRRLVDAAVAWARLDGIRTLTATMLADNPAIQRLLTGLGLPSVAASVGAGVIEVRIDLGVARSAA
jgi:GNAT superfamily N-acetyltransferase